MSFPRRRESRNVLLKKLDVRLRGNDGKNFPTGHFNWIYETVGGIMRTKAIVIKRKKCTGIIMISALMLVSILVIIGFAFQAYGAGAVKASTKESKSAA